MVTLRVSCQREAGLAVEDCLPVAAERFQEDVLHRLGVPVTDVELASALSLANVDPQQATQALVLRHVHPPQGVKPASLQSSGTPTGRT